MAYNNPHVESLPPDDKYYKENNAGEPIRFSLEIESDQLFSRNTLGNIRNNRRATQNDNLQAQKNSDEEDPHSFNRPENNHSSLHSFGEEPEFKDEVHLSKKIKIRGTYNYLSRTQIFSIRDCRQKLQKFCHFHIWNPCLQNLKYHLKEAKSN